MFMRKYCTFLLLVLVAVSVARAGDWPHWRGPYFNGSTDEKDLPSNWSKTEKIVWSVDLAGSSAATPIIWADRVFLSGVDSDRDTLLAMCFDRKSGKLLWRDDVAKGISHDRRSTFAASSPVTDGKIVVFFYANGDLVCFDLNGRRQWARNLHDDYGPFAFLWTFGAGARPWSERQKERIVRFGHGAGNRQDPMASDPSE
jgi:outer membrane protein assembly factor BamB